MSVVVSGVYRRDRAVPGNDWHFGELFFLGNGTWRWVNNAGAMWKCFAEGSCDSPAEISENDASQRTATKEDEQETHSSFSINWHGKILLSPVSSAEHPERSSSSAQDEVFEISIVHHQISFKLGNHIFLRFEDSCSYPLAEKFFSELFAGSGNKTEQCGVISFATPIFRIMMESILEAQQAYFHRNFSKFRKIVSELRNRCPVGNSVWSQPKFLSEDLIALQSFDPYAVFRIMDFIERKMTQFENSESPKEKTLDFNLTIIAVETATTMNAASNRQSTETHTLDERFVNLENTQHSPENKISTSDFAGENIFSNQLWDAKMPSCLRPVLYWFGELLYFATNRKLRMKTTYQVLGGDVVAMQIDSEAEKSVFPQFPWSDFVKNERGKQLMISTDQFLIIHPHVEQTGCRRLTTCGIGFAPSGKPLLVLDDKSIFEREHRGSDSNVCSATSSSSETTTTTTRGFVDNTRSFFFSHWILHETCHAWFGSENFYKHLNLEPIPHCWNDRTKWPTDFVVSETGHEVDFFFESLEKRILCGRTRPFWMRLKFIRNDSDLTNQDLVIKIQTAPRIPLEPSKILSVFKLFDFGGRRVLDSSEFVCALLQLFSSANSVLLRTELTRLGKISQCSIEEFQRIVENLESVL